MATEQQLANLAKARAARRASIEAKRNMPAELPPLPKRKAMPASWPVTPGEMLGLTSTDCCVDCTFERCAITGKPYCGHPNKGGLWPQDKVKPEIVERFNKARKKLLHAEIDRRP